MYSLILPELIVDVFTETGNKNTIKHFLAANGIANSLTTNNKMGKSKRKLNK